MVPVKGRGGALLRNDEFVDKVYRILEMICEARGNEPLWVPLTFIGVSISDLERRIATQYQNKTSEARGGNTSKSPRG